MHAKHRRSDSCEDCVGPDGEDVSGGYYEAGGSFLKLGLVEAFLVCHHFLSRTADERTLTSGCSMIQPVNHAHCAADQLLWCSGCLYLHLITVSFFHPSRIVQ